MRPDFTVHYISAITGKNIDVLIDWICLVLEGFDQKSKHAKSYTAGLTRRIFMAFIIPFCLTLNQKKC